MVTEEELIYTIHDVIRSGSINQDDPINERLMRNFLSIHRGKLLNTISRKGDLIPDEAFQSFGEISFVDKNGEFISNTIPKVIRFKDNQGMMFSKDGYVISVLNSEEFLNARNDRFNKYHPRLKFINRKLTLFLGKEISCGQGDVSGSLLNSVVRKLHEESKSKAIKIQGNGVLVRTDDEPGYDWTRDPYPMPDELIENLINSVNAREFNIFLKTKSDETGDGRNNTSEFNTREEL